MKSVAAILALVIAAAGTLQAQGPDTVFIEELTWTEIRDRIENGTTSVIIATGGTEQNGPHMVMGKHNFIIKVTSERIARELGNTLVAPVVAYVPEGDPDNVSNPGVISLPNDAFVLLLEYAARSLKSGGFTDIILIGDSGGNQRGMQQVAEKLNEAWAGTRARVHYAPDYYRNNGFADWLESEGETREAIGSHAGITDTSQVMAVDSNLIWFHQRVAMGGFEGAGVRGDPTRATVDYGRVGLQMKVDAALRQIRELMSQD